MLVMFGDSGQLEFRENPLGVIAVSKTKPVV